MRDAIFATTLTLVLAACAPEAEVPGDGNATVAAQDAPRREMPPVPKAKPAPAEPATKQSVGAPELSIPTSIRGKWRQSEAESITAAQCDPVRGDNAVYILVVRADGYSQFETGGRLLSIAERGDTRIRATFDTTYADEPTQGEYMLDVNDGGRTLTVRELADGGRPIRYRRCPG